jgi:hypothetical protein
MAAYSILYTYQQLVWLKSTHLKGGPHAFVCTEWAQYQCTICIFIRLCLCFIPIAQSVLCRAADSVPGVADHGSGEQEPPRTAPPRAAGTQTYLPSPKNIFQFPESFPLNRHRNGPFQRWLTGFRGIESHGSGDENNNGIKLNLIGLECGNAS